MSWLLCRPHLLPPPFNLCALVPHFRVRPLLQVRLLPPGSPVHSGPPTFRISPLVQVRLRHTGPVRVRRRVDVRNYVDFFVLQGTFRVSPPPVDLFSGIRARKRPTDMEPTICFRAGYWVSDRPHGPWLQCRQTINQEGIYLVTSTSSRRARGLYKAESVLDVIIWCRPPGYSFVLTLRGILVLPF